MANPDYFSKTAPTQFGFVEADIRETFSSEFPDWITLSCGLHYLVANGTDYFLSGSDIPSPSEMLGRLQGDCEDQSVLLASCYMAAGLEPRFVIISDNEGNNGHVLPEVYCPVPDPDTTSSVIRKFYRRELDLDIDTISWEDCSRSGYWFVADPEFSRYVGDIQDLERDGYIRNTGSEWEWCTLREVQE